MVYADDDMVVTGDHFDIDPSFTAQRNALFLARSAIPHAFESVRQVAEYKKSWVTAMRAGRAVPGPYANAAGTPITDASTARTVKVFRYFFPRPICATTLRFTTPSRPSCTSTQSTSPASRCPMISDWPQCSALLARRGDTTQEAPHTRPDATHTSTPLSIDRTRRPCRTSHSPDQTHW